MSDFDPDKYLAEKGGGGTFDPDAYLKAKEPRSYEESRARIMEASAHKPTQAGAALGGFASGASKNWADELAGQVYEKGNLIRNGLNGVPNAEAEARRTDDYRHGRDTTRDELKRETDAFPKTTTAANIGGDLATEAIMAYGTQGASLTPGGQALSGAVAGAGNSDADLTLKGRGVGDYLKSIGETGLEAGVGAGMSYGGAKIGNKLGGVLKNSRLAKYFEGKVGSAVGDAANAVKSEADDALRSGIGKLGGESSGASRTLALLRGIIEDPGADMAQKKAALLFLDSTAGKELVGGVYAGAIERAPGELSRVSSARAALDPLKQAIEPAAISTATDAALSGNVAKDKTTSLIRHFMNKAAPLGLMYGATKMGVPVGVAGAMGGAAALALGHPGTKLANYLKTPAVRAAAWGAVSSLLQKSPERLGKYGGVLARELERNGAEAALSKHEQLIDTDEGYAQLVTDLAGEAKP